MARTTKTASTFTLRIAHHLPATLLSRARALRVGWGTPDDARRRFWAAPGVAAPHREAANVYRKTW